jgi:cation:H+ antiporter
MNSSRKALELPGIAQRDHWPTTSIPRRASDVAVPWLSARSAFGSFVIVTLALLLLLAAAIYLSCEYFVNGVEWVGRRLHLGATTTGTLLAAFGTALPESAVTFVAVVVGKDPAQKDIGVGAALGGPLVLATIAYTVIGAVLLMNRKRLQRADACVNVDHKRLSRDQMWFLVIFVVKVALGLVVFSFKPLLGVLFLLAYAAYVWREMTTQEHPADEHSLEPLKFRPRTPSPSLSWALAQTLLALVVIGFAAQSFVGQLDALATYLRWPPHLVALLLSPVATELPETMNAVIWVRQGRERLAFANVSGAMMIQATVPSALGLFFTPWHFDTVLTWAGILTAVAVVILWSLFQRGRVRAGNLIPIILIYGVFAVIALV